MTKRSLRNTVATIGCATLALAGLTAAPADAAPGDVQINELLYHAADADLTYGALEFVELRNTGSEPVDVGGWQFTAGITGTAIPAGVTIPAGGYLVGTNDAALLQARFGFAAGFVFETGEALSNGGELVTLADAAGGVIDSVLYDDAVPWPLSPDGAGPSLELDPSATDNAATSWHASSVDFGTPAAANSAAPMALTGVGPDSVTPEPGADVTLTATAPAGSTVTLTYKVMYAADVVIPMADDAASPGGAADGVYAATIPGAGAGELVRYRVSATKGTQAASYPAEGDSRPYDGYVVRDPELDSATYPVLQWFMSDEVYQDMITNHRCDDYDAQATFAYGGRVLDGGLMHIKGQSTCTAAKAKWDVELPKGYTFDFGQNFPYPVKKFDIQNERVPRSRIGWEVAAATRELTVGHGTVRIQRNGKFHSVVTILENYDGTWRKTHGMDVPMYKVQGGGLKSYTSPEAMAATGDVEKKNPDDTDFSDIWQLTQRLAAPDSPEKFAWIRANLALPQIANYTAHTVVTRRWDTGTRNFYMVKNPQTGRWQVLAWDFDNVFNNATDGKGAFLTPLLDRPGLWQTLFKMPDFQAMHYRRVRTLHDRFLVGNGLVDRFDELTVGHESDLALDVAKWGGPTLATARGVFVAGVEERRREIANGTTNGIIPTSQSPTAAPVVNEIQAVPGATRPEYLEVYNPGTTGLDISDWSIPAVGLTQLIPGTVVPPKSYLVWSNDDAKLVSAFGGDFIAGGIFSGDLADTGEEVAILDGARVADSVTYATTSPWPGPSGPSLELKDPALDNSLGANWAFSTDARSGTAGTRNAVFVQPPSTTTTVFPFGSTWKWYPWVTPNQYWKNLTFNDSSWRTGPGPLGFRSTQKTTINTATGRVSYDVRKTFDIGSGPRAGVTLRLRRDDGAVVYVNGVEVARSNMPAGAITPMTRAKSDVLPGKQGTTYSITLPPSAFRNGSNTIALEVHQFTATATSDVFFDASLVVRSS